MSSFRVMVVSAAVVAAMVVGCGSESEKKEGTPDASTMSTSSGGSSGASTSSGTSGTPTGPACAVASDCRLSSVSCDDCTCTALRASDPDPVCPNGEVACFDNPCSGKSAACVGGKCTFVAQGDPDAGRSCNTAGAQCCDPFPGDGPNFCEGGLQCCADGKCAASCS